MEIGHSSLHPFAPGVLWIRPHLTLHLCSGQQGTSRNGPAAIVSHLSLHLLEVFMLNDTFWSLHNIVFNTSNEKHSFPCGKWFIQTAGNPWPIKIQLGDSQQEDVQSYTCLFWSSFHWIQYVCLSGKHTQDFSFKLCFSSPSLPLSKHLPEYGFCHALHPDFLGLFS